MSAEAEGLVERLTAERDSWREQFHSAANAASEYASFWEQHSNDFDAAGNYIPHSQMDGDLRAQTARADALQAELEEVRAVLPHAVGRLQLGKRPAENERYCHEGHVVPDGHPLYWPQGMGEYDDDDPRCLEHAIIAAECDAGYCSTCINAEFNAENAKGRALSAEALVGTLVEAMEQVLAVRYAEECEECGIGQTDAWRAARTALEAARAARSGEG